MSVFSEYENYDGIALAELIAKREISPREVLDAAIERTEALNPQLNAIVHKLYDDAAATLATTLPASALSGVPFLLKDLNLLYAGAPLSNGSRLFADFIPDHDSTLTQRYKDAGLVIFGKTNTPEMGIAMATEPALHGPTRNPWNPALSAAGSSGGAAAAVAAGIVPLAHATDGGGSIRMPAANCGLFGLKPSRARNPMGPDVGEGWSGLACGHCVSRSVRDSAALLDLTHGPAPGDPYHAPPPAQPYLAALDSAPGSLRIAFDSRPPQDFPLHPECRQGQRQAAELCEALGHTVIETHFEYDFAALQEALWVIISSNLRNALDLRWQALGRTPSADDVERVTWLCRESSARYSGADYARAVQTCHVVGRRLGEFFQHYDLILTPTMTQPPLPLHTIDMMADDLDQYLSTMTAVMPYTPLYNVTGCPAMSVPLHWSSDGLPIGIHFGAAYGREDVLFQLAAQLEQAQPWFDRRPPLPQT